MSNAVVFIDCNRRDQEATPSQALRRHGRASITARLSRPAQSVWLSRIFAVGSRCRTRVSGRLQILAHTVGRDELVAVMWEV
jgi:hypothetical protein